jgi:L-rhamnose mutarotase
MAAPTAAGKRPPMKIGMTLDIADGKVCVCAREQRGPVCVEVFALPVTLRPSLPHASPKPATPITPPPPPTHTNTHTRAAIQLAEYRSQHNTIWPEVKAALAGVGLTNISLWAWPGGSRLFYYAEFVGEEPFEEAMARYAGMPRIAEWEALMHSYQRRLVPAAGEGGEGGQGGDGEGASVWWRAMECVYSSDF